MKNLIKILILLFATSISAFEDNDYITKQFSIKDGLSQVSVFCSLQDSDGYLWFGTRNGLNKFDGLKFENYYAKEGDFGLTSNNINSLLEDTHKNIWVGTINGLNIIEHATKKVIKVKLPHKNTYVHKLFKDSKNRIWVGTTKGLLVCENFKNNVREIKIGSSTNFVTSINEDFNGDIIFGTSKGKMYKYINGKCEEFENLGIKKTITFIIPITKSKIWIGTDGEGLHKISTSGNKTIVEKTATNNKGKYRVFWRERNKIWIGSYKGLVLFDLVKEKFENIKISNPEGVNVLQKSIRTIYKDNANTLWVGTFFDGVYQLTQNRSGFKHYSKEQKKNVLNSNLISTINKDELGNLWIGTEDKGLIFIDQLTGKPNNIPLITKEDKHESPIKAILFDNDHNLWIANSFNGLKKYNLKNKKTTSFHKTLKSNDLRTIAWKSKNEIWIGTAQEGIFIFNILTNSSTQYKAVLNDDNSISDNHILAIYKDSNENHWVSTGDGSLQKYNELENHFEKIVFPNNRRYLINSITEDSFGNLLLATETNGILVFNENNGITKEINIENGLPSKTILKITKADNGRFWYSYLLGFGSFDLKNGNFENYDLLSNIPIKEIHKNSLLVDQNNNVYVGGIGGFISFNASKKNNTNLKVPLLIKKLKLFEKTVRPGDSTNILTKSIERTNEIVMNHHQSRFTFEIAALNFITPKANKYSYKLEGLDTDWNNLGSKRFITFSNLPAGSYILKIKGSTKIGEWNLDQKEIKITILAPWWKTKIAYTCYIIVILLTIYSILLYLISLQKRKSKKEIQQLEQKKEREFNQFKLRFYENISHEFFTPLTLISGPLEYLAQKNRFDEIQTKNIKYIQNNADRLTKLVEQLMSYRKLETEKITLKIEPINLAELLLPIFNSFKPLANEKEIDFTENFSNKKLDVWGDKTYLEHIFYNIISNAFKNTNNNGNIHISTAKNSNNISVSIKDDGKGIAPEMHEKIFDRYYQVSDKNKTHGTGIGLAFVKTLVSKHNANIKLESELGKGAEFNISFTKGNTHFFGRDDVILSEKKNTSKADLPEVEHTNSAKENTTNETILIVEDNKELAEFIGDYINQYYQVLVAHNPKQAFKILAKKKPNLIISDVMMPGIDGIEFCSKIKASQETKDIPLLLLTAKTNEADIKRGLKAGADDYIKKPFTPEIIKIKIDNFLGRTKILKEKYSEEILLPVEDRNIESQDEKTLRKIVNYIEKEISNPNLTVEMIYNAVGLSKSSMYRKVKETTGKSPVQFLRYMKIKTAARYLEEGKLSVAEVAFKVGFQDLTYFRNCFKKEMNVLPSAYLKNKSE